MSDALQDGFSVALGCVAVRLMVQAPHALQPAPRVQICKRHGFNFALVLRSANALHATRWVSSAERTARHVVVYSLKVATAKESMGAAIEAAAVLPVVAMASALPLV